MLIWRGKGIFALLIAVLINLIINESSNAYFGIPEGFHHYRDAHQWVWLLGMGLSALACWYLGLWVEADTLRNAKLLLDPETGQEVRVLAAHDLFWIPIKWWAVVWVVAGLWLASR
jgi:hypothetical protein